MSIPALNNSCDFDSSGYIVLMNISQQIAKRLDEAIKLAKFKTQADLSRASGVPQPTISRILKGQGEQGPEASTLVKLAEACNVSWFWLMEGIGAMRPTVKALDDDDDNTDTYRVKKVTLRLQAGITGYAIDQEVAEGNPIFFRRDWMHERGYKPTNLIAIGVKGDSMETGLFDGDTVVVNTADRMPVDGHVFAVNYEGEAVIKRLIRDKGTWWLSSDNPDQRRHPRKECSGEMCIIIGKVVHKQSERI